jgi:hypothetical protein
VGGRTSAPTSAIVSEEVVFNLKRAKVLRRLELRISGTVDGFAVKQGPRTEHHRRA